MDEATIPTPTARFTISKLAAIFCAVAVFFSMITYASTEPFAISDSLNLAEEALEEAKHQYEELLEKKSAIALKYGDMTEQEAKVAQYYSDWQTKLGELRKLCSENSFSRYSWYDCYDCNYRCEPLHKAAEEAYDKYDEANDEIAEYKEEMDPVENQLEIQLRNVSTLQEKFDKLDDIYGDALYHFFSLFTMWTSLIVLAVYLVMERSNRYLGFGAAAGGVLASFLLYCGDGTSDASLLRIILHPTLFSLVAFSMFIVLSLKEDKENLVKFRVIAIVMASLASFFTLVIASGSILTLITVLLYLTAMILTAFAFVPLDFKEYIKVAMHIFLSIITFGIWRLVWVYYVTKNLGKVDSLEKRNPVNELLLYMFLPFYGVYWLYKNAEYVEAFGEENGKKVNKISILCFIIGFFSPLLSTILMQDKINQIVGRPE